jgi:hypothetical protein
VGHSAATANPKPAQAAIAANLICMDRMVLAIF